MSTRSRGRALLAAIVVTGAALGAPATAAPEDGLAATGPESTLLPGLRNGQRAISALGDDLSTAAVRNGMTTGQLVENLEADDDLWVDATGRLLFIDDGLHAEAPTGDDVGGQLATGRDIPPSQAFQLSSRPSSTKTIHLDFDGFDTTGRIWEGQFPTVVGAWDLDGQPNSFSTTERQIIIEIWARVAEDFAPFDVDVTTIDPGQAALDRSRRRDKVYGSSVVFADQQAQSTYNCGCGGVAYVGTYDLTNNVNSFYQPAWVFPGALAQNAKNMAEAASHEAGHNLGLVHDGKGNVPYYTGHNGWAPIMGVGYYEPVSQWSKGEYNGATTTQDDIAVMNSNGLSIVGDDHGDGAAAATPLEAAVDEVGVIAADGDVDAFAIDAGAGRLTVAARVADVGANLDVRLTLLDAGGTVVATADPAMSRVSVAVADGLEATLDRTVAAGRYTLLVEGVGVRSVNDGYSGYASIGAYSLTGSFVEPGGGPAPNDPPTARISSSTDELTVSVDGRGSDDTDGTVVSHAWTFGDGATATGETATHTYQAAGTYTVRLTVTDDDGDTGTATTSVTVSVAEPPPSGDDPPTAPTGVTATSHGSTATISWTDTSDNETGFAVIREKQRRNGSWTWAITVADVGPDVTSVTVDPGRGTLRFRVVASNDAGSTESAWSNTIVTTR